jgi:hypothetical protein
MRLAPAHLPGFVKISLKYGTQVVSLNENNTLFEYRKQKNQRKTKKICELNPKEEGDHYDREFKVRIIDNLDSINNLLASQSPAEGEGAYRQMSSVLHDCGRNVEECNEEVLAKVMTTLFEQYTKEFGKDRIKSALNNLDEHGFAMIHYVCALSNASLLAFHHCRLFAMPSNTSQIQCGSESGRSEQNHTPANRSVSAL